MLNRKRLSHTFRLPSESGPQTGGLMDVWGGVGDVAPSLRLQRLGRLVNVCWFEPHCTHIMCMQR